MANKKTSQLDELHNIQNDDLVEITKYMGAGLGDGGGDYKSYKMTWQALKAFFKYDEIVTIENNGEGHATYIADRWTLISFWATPYENVAITMTDGLGSELFNVEEGNTGGILMKTNNLSLIDSRTYNFTFSEDFGRVYLFITKNLTTL